MLPPDHDDKKVGSPFSRSLQHVSFLLCWVYVSGSDRWVYDGEEGGVTDGEKKVRTNAG